MPPPARVGLPSYTVRDEGGMIAAPRPRGLALNLQCRGLAQWCRPPPAWACPFLGYARSLGDMPPPARVGLPNGGRHGRRETAAAPRPRGLAQWRAAGAA